MTPLRVFIGYDSREPVAYHVLISSIMRSSSRPVSITPLSRPMLQFHTRAIGNESTEFSYTRFLVPYLSGYEGISIYLDSDMLVLTDLRELLQLMYESPNHKAVWVCPHDYQPRATKKFLGQSQTSYPRKNWSSMMIFQNAQCRALTPAYVNDASGMNLHRFQWLDDESIGFLPLEWNYLVGEDHQVAPPKIVHYTNGTPCFEAYQDCEYAALWWQEYRAVRKPR